jgi:hypothetical protein
MNLKIVNGSLLFLVAACASQSQAQRPNTFEWPAPQLGPTLGVAKLVKEDASSHYIEVFLPSEFLPTPRAEVWVQEHGASQPATVPFGMVLDFFDEKGLIGTTSPVATASQKIWCESDADSKVGTFVRLSLDKKFLKRMTANSKRMDNIVAFVRARLSPPSGKDDGAFPDLPKVSLQTAASDAGCGDGLNDSALRLVTPAGSADLRCCGP